MLWFSFIYLFFFFFKQKTAYEMRISDWSSDVCSSDLRDGATRERPAARARDAGVQIAVDDVVIDASCGAHDEGANQEQQHQQGFARQIGRASCRERVCQYV